MHHDANGWPCVGKYIGILLDNGDYPIFYTPEQMEKRKYQIENQEKFQQFCNTFFNEKRSDFLAGLFGKGPNII